MPRSFELIEDRALRPLIPVTTFREIGNGVPDRLHLGDLAVKLGNVGEREPLDVPAGTPAVTIEQKQRGHVLVCAVPTSPCSTYNRDEFPDRG